LGMVRPLGKRGWTLRTGKKTWVIVDICWCVFSGYSKSRFWVKNFKIKLLWSKSWGLLGEMNEVPNFGLSFLGIGRCFCSVVTVVKSDHLHLLQLKDFD
jgi:hypothetical protein